MFSNRGIHAWLILAIFSFTGCGGSSVKFAEVEGTITLGGKPIDKIMVEFWAMGEGARSFGETDSQGHFKLTSDDGKRAGASVGQHKVVLHVVGIYSDKFKGREAADKDISEGRKPRISAKYANPETTKISEKVEANKKNQFTFEDEKF